MNDVQLAIDALTRVAQFTTDAELREKACRALLQIGLLCGKVENYVAAP